MNEGKERLDASKIADEKEGFFSRGAYASRLQNRKGSHRVRPGFLKEHCTWCAVRRENRQPKARGGEIINQSGAAIVIVIVIGAPITSFSARKGTKITLRSKMIRNAESNVKSFLTILKIETVLNMAY